ncbi:MAG: hypothetical protein WCE80_15855 [Acidimicrobiia bacterium]
MANRSAVHTPPARAWLRRPETWVLLVAVVYASSQLLLLDTSRFFSWDEAIYTSQVSPFADALSMGAHRARGVTLIVAPVAAITDSMPVLRSYLALVSSAGLFGAFVVWCRSVRWAAPIAAGLFATSWIAVYYGSAVYPNLYSALIAVAATGITLRVDTSESRTTLFVLGGVMTVGMLVRPTEAVIVAVCVVAVAFFEARPRIVAICVASLGGLTVGALPWLAEAWIRFEGPLQRLHAASAAVGGGLRSNVLDYLHTLDGSAGPINRWALLDFGLLLLLGMAGLFRREPKMRRMAGIVMASAALLVSPYLFATEPIADRFMLPGYGMLCLGSALGVTAISHALERTGLATIVLAASVLLIGAWNYPALKAWDDRQVGNADTALTLGEAVEARSGSDDCFFLSPFNYPAISFASGCRGGPLADSATANQARVEAAGADRMILALTPEPDVLGILGAGWRCDPIPALAVKGWQICSRS